MTTPALGIPKTAHAGETIAFRLAPVGYGPATHSLEVALAGVAGAGHLAKLATDYGDGSHLVTITAAESGALTPGDYAVLARADDGAGVLTVVERGAITLRADLISGAADDRDPDEVALANVRAYLAGSTSKLVASYAVAGRSLSSYALSEILTLRDNLEAKVARLNRARALEAGTARPSRVRVVL